MDSDGFNVARLGGKVAGQMPAMSGMAGSGSQRSAVGRDESNMQFSGRKRFQMLDSRLRGVSNKKGMAIVEDEGSMKGVDGSTLQ